MTVRLHRTTSVLSLRGFGVVGLWFGRLGEWGVPRVLTVQFRGVGSSDIADFAKPDARVVVAPASYASGELVVPYRAAAAAR